MALPAGLQNLLNSIGSDTFQNLPAEDKSAGLEMLTAAELKKAEKKDEFGKITTLISSWFTAAQNGRRSEEQVWYKNLDMAQGRQFTEWSDQKRTMVQTPSLPHKPRLAVNIIEPVVRTEIAKTSSTHPTASVSPASNDDQDIMAALAGEQVWEWFYAGSDYQVKVFTPSNFWRVHTGQGFIKTFYDEGCIDDAATEAAKRQAKDDAEQQQQMATAVPSIMQPVGDQGGGAFGQAPQPMPGLGAAAGILPQIPAGLPPIPPGTPMDVPPVRGKIKAEPVSPFNIFVGDLLEPDIQKQPWVLHVYLKTIESAKLSYADYLPKEWTASAVVSTMLMDPAHLGMKSSNTANPDSVLVIEAWIKPGAHRLFPQGGLVITVGDTVVAMSRDGIPYKHGEYPFQMITSIDTGRFYRKSVIASLTPIQNEVNRTYAQIIEFKNHIINPQTYYDEGSLDPRKVTTKPGQYIPVRLGMKRPEPVQRQSLPAFVGDLIDRVKNAADDISGQHQISRASAPGADTAASALSILQEVDDNFLSSTFDSIGLAVKSCAKQYLSLAVQYWDKPRFVKITGDDGSVDAQMLSGSNLENGTDIRIDDGSAMPLQKSARIATVTDWMDKGYITPELGMKALEMGMLGKVYKLLKVDEDQAIRENLYMKSLDPQTILQMQQQNMAAVAPALPDPNAMPDDPFAGIDDPAVGLSSAPQDAPVDPAAPVDPMAMMAPPAPEPVLPINSYDNDLVHVATHQRHMKSQAYQSYPDETKSVYEEHVAAHQARMASAIAQQQQQQALAGGQMLQQDDQGGSSNFPENKSHQAKSMQPLAEGGQNAPDGYDASSAPAPQPTA